MIPMDRLRATYLQECEELLERAESGLARLGEGGADDDTVNGVFRAVHSIKGGAGAFGFTRLIAFAHGFESALDGLRRGRLPADGPVIELLARAGDVLADLVRAAQQGTEAPAGLEDEMAAVLLALVGEGAAPAPAPAATPTPAPEPAAGQMVALPALLDPPTSETVRRVLLGALAKRVAVTIGAERVQRLSTATAQVLVAAERAFRAEGLGFALRAPSQAFSDAFRDLGLSPAEDLGGPARWLIRFKPHPDAMAGSGDPLPVLRELARLGRMAVEADLGGLPPLADLTPRDCWLAWRIRLATEAERPAVLAQFEFYEGKCELSIEAAEAPAVPAPTPAPQVATAPVPPPAPEAMHRPQGGSIRVDIEKVDRLVNMVGELVITQAMLAQQATTVPKDRHPLLFQGLDDLAHHARALQESVMAVRAQPVSVVFSRLPRLIRDLSAKTGKKIRLVMVGENTEVDKTVIERLGDPLTHLIRNAVDHGLETPEVRRGCGKPEEGTIHLIAEHRSGRIVVEIADDGAGLNRPKILARAVERGLVPPHAELSDDEIDQVVFLPGFSTADAVSDISGRGVGMDVVKNNIIDLGGRIVVRSITGVGATFILTLPLTLAVIDGMVVKVGAQIYVVPLANIIETLRPAPSQVNRLVSSGEVLSIRGEYLRLVRLADIFGIAGAQADASRAIVVLVESEDGGRLGLVVDDILGQQQVVIKSLEENFRRLEGLAGATILGSGAVALIVDVGGLGALADRRRIGPATS